MLRVGHAAGWPYACCGLAMLQVGHAAGWPCCGLAMLRVGHAAGWPCCALAMLRVGHAAGWRMLRVGACCLTHSVETFHCFFYILTGWLKALHTYFDIHLLRAADFKARIASSSDCQRMKSYQTEIDKNGTVIILQTNFL